MAIGLLIDKRDNFEIVRDEIAAILAVKYIETALEGPDQNFELLQVQATTTTNGQVTIDFDLN